MHNPRAPVHVVLIVVRSGGRRRARGVLAGREPVARGPVVAVASGAPAGGPVGVPRAGPGVPGRGRVAQRVVLVRGGGREAVDGG